MDLNQYLDRMSIKTTIIRILHVRKAYIRFLHPLAMEKSTYLRGIWERDFKDIDQTDLQGGQSHFHELHFGLSNWNKGELDQRYRPNWFTGRPVTLSRASFWASIYSRSNYYYFPKKLHPRDKSACEIGLARAINWDLFRAAEGSELRAWWAFGPSCDYRLVRRTSLVSHNGLRPLCSTSASKLASNPLGFVSSCRRQRVKSGPSDRDT